jgi:hypothetical protein
MDSKMVVAVGALFGVGARSVVMAATGMTFTCTLDDRVCGVIVMTKDQVLALSLHQK